MAPQTKSRGKHACDQCEKIFTRPHDLKRHRITHLDGELLEKEKHPCPITEIGCGRRMLQLTNLRKHVQSIHRDVEHLVCFDCRPDFQQFPDSAALDNHIRVEHPPKQTQTCQIKRRRKTTKRPPHPPPSPIDNPYDSASDISPQPPTGTLPPMPLAPPPRKSRVELPDSVTIPMSAFPTDDPEPPRSTSHRRPEWYRASQPLPQFEVQPDAPALAPARRCHRTTRKPPTVHKRAQDECGIEHPRHLPSPAASSSSIGEGSGSSLGRFPLPPPPPPTTRLMTPAFTSNRLPSPRVSRAPSPTLDIPSSLTRESRRGSPKVRSTPYSRRSRQ
ncbi:hypothetical protein IW262DRAFT_270705 [Armillaria fumosa]|nr:hypothetical protein IW262DRAFT_270705 [Armillaria fumosa]